MSFAHILVLCTGNICRSPMAELLLAQAMPDVRVESAGLGAMVGHRADPIACKLMQERGLDLDAHLARQIDLPMCQRASLILVMDTAQRQQVERLYPFTNGRVYRIGDAAGADVPDPYLGSRAHFEKALQLIEHGTQQWASRISRVSIR